MTTRHINDLAVVSAIALAAQQVMTRRMDLKPLLPDLGSLTARDVDHARGQLEAHIGRARGGLRKHDWADFISSIQTEALRLIPQSIDRQAFTEDLDIWAKNETRKAPPSPPSTVGAIMTNGRKS